MATQNGKPGSLQASTTPKPKGPDPYNPEGPLTRQLDGQGGVAGAVGRGALEFNSDVSKKLNVDPKYDPILQASKGNWGQATTNILLGTPGWSAIGNYFAGPQKEYFGGSSEALTGIRGNYASGVDAGRAATDTGLAGVGAGGNLLLQGAPYAQRGGTAFGSMAQNAQYDRERAGAMGAFGQNLTGQAVGQQTGYLRDMVGTAGRTTPSLAEAQLDQAMRTNQNALMSAAGGSALDRRNAMSNVNDANAQVAGQMAIVRAQEEAANRDRLMQAQANAAAQSGQQAGLGANTWNAGLGARMQANQQLGTAGSGFLQTGSTMGNLGTAYGNLGLGMANVGNQQQSTYVSGLNDVNKAQLEADIGHESARQENKKGIIGGAVKAVGSIFGF